MTAKKRIYQAGCDDEEKPTTWKKVEERMTGNRILHAARRGRALQQEGQAPFRLLVELVLLHIGTNRPNGGHIRRVAVDTELVTGLMRRHCHATKRRGAPEAARLRIELSDTF